MTIGRRNVLSRALDVEEMSSQSFLTHNLTWRTRCCAFYLGKNARRLREPSWMSTFVSMKGEAFSECRCPGPAHTGHTWQKGCSCNTQGPVGQRLGHIGGTQESPSSVLMKLGRRWNGWKTYYNRLLGGTNIRIGLCTSINADWDYKVKEVSGRQKKLLTREEWCSDRGRGGFFNIWLMKGERWERMRHVEEMKAMRKRHDDIYMRIGQWDRVFSRSW